MSSLNEKLNDEFLEACEDGDFIKARQLIEQGADAECSDEGVNTAAHLAIEAAGEDGTDEDGDALSFLKFVLTSHPGLKERKGGSYGETPLQRACGLGRLHIVRYLFREANCRVDTTDKQGNTPLHDAAWKGRLDIVKYLATEAKCNIDATNDRGSTPLHLAAMNGRLEMVNYLVTEAKCNIDATDDSGSTPLHYAAMQDEADVCAYLLEVGADPNIANTHGNTPLDYASDPGLRKILQQKDGEGSPPEEDKVTPEKQGSDVSEQGESDTPKVETTDHKAEQGDDDFTKDNLKELLDTCARVMRDKDSVDVTAMHGILFGLPRAGKSSLLERLIGRTPPTDSRSTLAAKESIQVTIQEVRERSRDATVTIGDQAAGLWRIVEGHDEEAVLVLNELPQVSTPTTSPDAPTPLPTPPPNPKPVTPSQPVPEAPPKPQAEQPQSSKDSRSQDTLQYFKECLRKKNWSELKRMFGRQWYLYLTDSGGQPEFQELITFLVSGPSIFFIVFRFDKDLDKLYEVEFIDEEGHSIKPYMSRHTALETVLQSFASVASIEAISHVQENGEVVYTKPRVLFVGTHKDLVSDEKIAQVEERFQKVIPALDTHKMVQWASDTEMIFSIDNTKSPEAEDIQRLRKTVHRLGSDPLTRSEYEIKTPCPWLLFGIMLRNPDHPDHVVHFEKCMQLGEGCGISEREELTKALGYLDRRIGTLRHVVEKGKSAVEPDRINFVVRTSQFLFTLVSDLIMRTFTFKNLPSERYACDEFTRKGIFNSNIFTTVAKTHSKVLTPAMLLTLLKQLRIVAPIQEEGVKQRYFMPCALAHVDAVKPSQPSDQSSPVKPLLFRFSCGCVPTGMFGALIAQLLQQKPATSSLQWKLVEDQIFRDQVTIELDRYTTVVLRMLPTYLSITLQSPLSLANDQDDLSQLCCEVRHELNGSIIQVAQCLQYGRSFSPSPCFFCPEVEEGKESVDSHIAIINNDRYGEYLECSRVHTKWNPQDVPSYSIWLDQEGTKDGGARHGSRTCNEPEMHEFTYLENPTTGASVKIIKTIQAQWPQLVDLLRLPSYTVANLRAQPNYTPGAACREVFNIWLKGEDTLLMPKNWNTVIKVMGRLDNAKLGQDIKRVLTGQ